MPDHSTNLVIECNHVVKKFYFYDHRTSSIREWFIRSLTRKPINVREPLFTLQNFNLHVNKGESVSLIGSNGSGKSTALRLIAGIYKPSSGKVKTVGRIGTVIELGAGFHPELTGMENVQLYSAIMGLNSKELSLHYEEIVDFSGIGEFISMPIKYYSSGMIARLAFSVAICANPEILLLDEVLAVGDHSFRDKCIDRLCTFHDSGGTMIVASHDKALVNQMCSRAIWLDKGNSRMSGPVNDVFRSYEEHGD